MKRFIKTIQMALNKNVLFLVTVFVITGNCLEEIPKEKNQILETETIIRNTINSIFLTLKLKRIHETPTIQEYTALHKYFSSLSLHRNDYNLKKILELIKVNNEHKFYNGTDFIAVINEIIEKDKTNRTYLEDLSVISYIDKFITRLKELRDMYAPKTVYVNVNMKVLESLQNAHNKAFEDRRNDYDNITTSDNDFWEPSGRRIYKGERTKIKYFPFMASVHIFNNFHCAGSIIQSDLIITASSCLQLAWNNRFFRENPAFLSVRVGSSFYSGGGEVIPVLEIYFHPGYDPKSLRNNLCILRLVRHLKFRRRIKRVKRINIDRNPWDLPLTTPGVTILGWGAKGSSGIIFNPWKNILSFSILDIYPLQDCRDVYSREYVTRKHFCAGFLSKGGGACNRDVGAPGVVDGKLMGVVSFGSPTCGTPDAPTVFTKLGYYTDWIEDIMEKPVPISLKRTTERPVFDVLNFMPTEGYTTTTFKIPPLTGKKLEPLSIHDIDKALRLLDENLFKEFLSTMFTSSEIEKYKNVIRNQQENATENVRNTAENVKINNDFTDEERGVEFVTKMPDLDEDIIMKTEIATHSSESGNEEESKEDLQESYKREQSNEKEETEEISTNAESKVESNIVEFMKNIDLKKIIQEEVMITPRIKTKETKGTTESPVTLIYLSDTDKNDRIDLEDDGGISIEDYKFEDMTRSKSTNSNRILAENEIYGLLSDVIEEEVQNKLVKGFR